MRYRIIHIDENHTVSDVVDDAGKPLVISVPNALNLVSGDRLIFGSAVFEITERVFNVSNMGTATLKVKVVGMSLDVHDGVLGTKGNL